MRAWIVSQTEQGPTASLHTDFSEHDLMDGEVTVEVEYSSVNFKDGLAISGRPGVVRRHPLIAGIDVVGVVRESSSPGWMPGDRVFANGQGLGETHHGGYAEVARVPARWLQRAPDALSSAQIAAIGTAGFTAMMSVLRLADADALGGEVVVTGASGGVGTLATLLLAGRGVHVVASSGSHDQHDMLRRLGARDIQDRSHLSEPGKPLQNERWSGAIDSVGGPTLANVLSQTRYGGTVTACGLASGPDLPASVMPFILRGVTLAGINSVFAPHELRERAWAALAAEIDLAALDSITRTVPLDAVSEVAHDILTGAVHGRVVVDVRA